MVYSMGISHPNWSHAIPWYGIERGVRYHTFIKIWDGIKVG